MHNIRVTLSERVCVVQKVETKKSKQQREREREQESNTRFILPCGSRSVKSRSGASFSSSACISTPKSSKGGDKGAEVQEVELKRASGNGDPGCCGEGGRSSSIGEVAPNNNRTNGESQLDDYNQVIRESFKNFWMENIFKGFSY